MSKTFKTALIAGKNVCVCLCVCVFVGRRAIAQA